MKFIFFILILINSAHAFSNELTCSLKGTRIHFVNGIGNEEKDAIDSKDMLDSKFKSISFKIDRIKKVEFDYTYNHTFGFIEDLLESGAQKIHSKAAEAEIDISIETSYVLLLKRFTHFLAQFPLNCYLLYMNGLLTFKQEREANNWIQIHSKKISLLY